MEKGIEFQHGTDCLRGILHTPVSAVDKKVGVVFLNGLVYRTGPERLYVKAARELAEAGYSCLRFDSRGMGNSSGEMGKVNFDLHSDTSASIRAMDFLEAETAVRKIALVGMCTGARNAVWTARKDPRVRSLILLSLPISFDRTRTPLYAITRSQMGEKVKMPLNTMVKKVVSTSAGRIARKVWRVVKSAQYSFFKYPIDMFRRVSLTLKGMRPDPIIREGIYRSCRQLIDDGRKILFVYGEEDAALVKDFRQHFTAQENAAKTDGSDLYDYWSFEKTGHALSGIATQDELIRRIVGWLSCVESGMKTNHREHEVSEG